jgi:hypothetical protein
MTTFAELDPASLPSYPAKAHKTGQARIVIDNRSQYLGRFGTSESLALYHLVCLNKLLTGSTPCTKDLREQLARIAGEQPPPRPAYTRPTFQLVVLLVTACLSAAIGAVSAWERNTELVQVNKPVLADRTDLEPHEVSIPTLQELRANVTRLEELNPTSSFSEILDQATRSIRDIEERIDKKERQDAPATPATPEEDVGS